MNLKDQLASLRKESTQPRIEEILEQKIVPDKEPDPETGELDNKEVLLQNIKILHEDIEDGIRIRDAIEMVYRVLSEHPDLGDLLLDEDIGMLTRHLRTQRDHIVAAKTAKKDGTAKRKSERGLSEGMMGDILGGLDL